MARGIGGTKKRGSKTKAPCPVCGQVMTKAGLVGHMAWKHGKDAKRPMLPSKARPVHEVMRKATAWDLSSPAHKLFCQLEKVAEKRQGEAYMADALPLIEAHMREYGVTEAQLYQQLEKQKRQYGEIQRLVKATWPKGIK